MFTFTVKGNFSKTKSFLERIKQLWTLKVFDVYGAKGVAALAEATPKDTGLTSESWSYKITQTRSRITLSFHNSNIQNGVPIAIILHYGHGTRSGSWVQGRNYINTSIQPIFDQMAKALWKEVTGK